MPEIIDNDFSTIVNYQGIKDIPNTIKSINDLSGSINDIQNSIRASQIEDLPSEFQSSLNTLQNKLEETKNTFRNFSTDYSNYSTRLTNAVPQIVASSMFNEQITDENIKHITKETQELEQDIINKRRMTEINNYYSNLNTYVNITIRNLLIILAIIIIFTVLSKKNIIPTNISTFITIICIITIIIYVLYSIYDINIRDKFNFNQYIIPFDEKAKLLERKGNLVDIKDILEGEFLSGLQAIENIGTCIGAACCISGTIYDYDANVCRTTTNTAGQTNPVGSFSYNTIGGVASNLIKGIKDKIDNDQERQVN